MKQIGRPKWLKGYMVAGVGALLVLSVAALIGASATPGKAKQNAALVSYTQTGRFSYTMYLKPSYLYGPTPEPTLSNPQYPLAAVGNIDFTFAFSPASPGWSGSASVEALLENPGIWQKTIALVPQSAVAGDFSLQFTLNPDQMNAIFDEIEKETGISASPRSLTLNVAIDSDSGSSLASLPMKLDKDMIEISSDLAEKLPLGNGSFNYQVDRKTADLPDASYPIEIVSGLSFSFNFAPAAPAAVTGEIDEVLEDPGIWQKSVTLVPATASSGTVSLSSVLDLVAVQKQFDDIDAETKLTTSPRLVTLRAKVVSGNDTFVQDLPLTIDKEVLDVPGQLALTLPEGSGKFSYSVNLKPNDLYSSSTLQPQPAPTSTAGDAGYEINLKPLQAPATTEETSLPAGQPAFVKLLDRMDLAFSYDFKSDQPVTNESTDVQITADLEAPQSWSKQLSLLHTTKTGSFTLSVPIDISGYSDLLDSIQKETGVSPDSVDISIVANLHTTGQTLYGPIDQTFAPTLKGAIKDNVLEWDKDLTTTQPGAISGPVTATKAPTFLGMAAGTAKGVAAFFMVVFILGFGLLLVLYMRPLQAALSPVEHEVLQIKKKYGARVVEGTGGSSPWGNNVVAVASFEDLIKVADELAKPVVHQGPADRYSPHTYYIMDGNNRYQYRIESDLGSPRSPSEQTQ